MTLKSVPLAKYYQLAQILRQQIIDGELKPNTQLPTENSLGKTYGLSRGTVRQAIQWLAQEGLIRREQGRGTFVNVPEAPLTTFTLSGFDEQMQREQRLPGTRILTQNIVPASSAVASQLKLAPNTPIIHLKRLRLADDQPIVYENRFLAKSLCPELVHEDLVNQSVSRLLIHKYKLPLIRLTQTIEVRALSQKEAQYLSGQAGMTAFSVKRLTYTRNKTGERPAVLYQALCRNDEYHFKAEFLASM